MGNYLPIPHKQCAKAMLLSQDAPQGALTPYG